MSSKSERVLGSDKLPMLVEGEWSLKKYELVERYARAFNKAIKGKFVNRAYIDLFSGTGLVKIKGTDDEAMGCALRALNVEPAFTHFRFCELEPSNRAALEARVLRLTPKRYDACKFFEGDSNQLTDQVLASFPKPSRTNTFLGFCLIDPFGASGFKFETIQRLSRYRMDFLVLVPTGMDFRRNKNFLLSKPELADQFLGNKNWRSAWQRGSKVGKDFGVFMLDQFGQSMQGLGYKYNGPQESFPVHLPELNVLLYHMAFFSKSDLGTKLFKECKRYMTPQLDFLQAIDER